jgi:hypothetical protein
MHLRKADACCIDPVGRYEFWRQGSSLCLYDGSAQNAGLKKSKVMIGRGRGSSGQQDGTGNIVGVLYTRCTKYCVVPTLFFLVFAML